MDKPELTLEQQFRIRFTQDTISDLLDAGRKEEVITLIGDILRHDLARENYLMGQLGRGLGLLQ